MVIINMDGKVFYTMTGIQSPVGMLTLACDEGGESLTGLWIEGQKYHGCASAGHPTAAAANMDAGERPDMPVFAAARRWLESYFAGEKPSAAELPLSPAGTAFRLGVWAILREIPYGAVVTYGAVAAKMAADQNGRGVSARAVGGAVGHNPISIIIPCHRVVGRDGSLTGYAGGVGVKAKLLELESGRG